MDEVKTKGKVLIIDDTVSIIDMVKAALIENNFSVLVSTSGAKGIKSAKLAKPDLILLDILMPEMDGYETCQALKADDDTKEIPVIFMSALSDVFDKVKAFKLGAVDYLTKPIDIEELLARTTTQIKLHQLQMQLIQSNDRLEKQVEERTEELKLKNEEYEALNEELRERYEELQAAEEELRASNDELRNNIEWLYQSEKKLSDAENIAMVGHWEFHLSRNLVIASKSARKIYGIDPDKETLTIPETQLIPIPEHRDAMDAALKNLIASGTHYDITFKIKRLNDGKIRDIHSVAEYRKDHKMVFGVIHDITDLKKIENDLNLKNKELEKSNEQLKQTEEKLKDINKELLKNIEKYEESEYHLKEAQRLAKLGHYSLDFSTGFWTSSEELDRLFGIDENYQRNVEGWINLVHPDFQKDMLNYFTEHVVKNKNMFDKQYKIVNQTTKKSYWVHGLGNLTFDSKGNLLQMLGSIQDITEQKIAAIEKQIANEELSKERDLLQALMDNAPDTIYFKDVRSRFTRINLAQTKLLGITHPYEAFGKTDFDFFDAEHAQNAFNDEQTILKTGKPIINQTEKVISAGRKRWVSTTKVPIINETGIITGIVGITRDISQQIKIEQALKQSEERFQLAMKASNDGLFDWNIVTGEVFYSPNWKKMLGYSEDEIGTDVKSWEVLTHKDDIENAQKLINEILENKRESFQTEFRMKHKKGHWVDIMSRARAVFNENGKPYRLVGTHTDITERNKTNKALLESEQRWKFAIEGNKDGLWDWDLIKNTVYYSPQWKAMLGFKDEEVQNDYKEWEKRVHPDDLPSTLEKINRHVSGETDEYQSTHRVLCKNGKYKWILDRGKIIQFNESGKPARMIGTHTDVTERIKAEKIIAENEERYRYLLETMQSGVTVYKPVKNNGDFKIIGLNKAAEKIKNIKRENIIDHTFLEVFPNMKETPLFDALKEVSKTGKAQHLPPYYFRDKAKIGWRENQIYKLPSGEIVTIFDDVTDKYIANRLDEIRLNINNFAAGNSSGKLLTKILDEAEILTQSKLGFYYLLDEDSGKIKLSALSSGTMQSMTGKKVEKNHPPIDMSGVWAECIQKRQAIIHNDNKGIPGINTIPESHPAILKEMVVPVIRNKKIVAVLGIGNKTDDYGIDDLKMIQQLADLAFETVLRKMTEESLLESENRFRNSFEKNTSVMLLIDPESLTLINANNSAIKYYGYSANELLSMKISDINTASNKDIATEMKNVVEERKRQFVFKHRLKSGEIRDVQVYSSPLEINSKIILHSIIQDITEQLKAEKALIENETQLQLIFDNSPAIMFLINEKAHVIRINKTGIVFAGRKNLKMGTQKPGQLLKCVNCLDSSDSCGQGPDCAECGFINTVLDTINTNTPHQKEEIELNVLIKNKPQHRYFEVSSVVASKTPDKTYLVTVDDITESKQAEEKIKQQEEHFRQMVEDIPIMINAFDKDGNFIFWNKECEKVTGYNAEEVIGSQDILKLLYPKENYLKYNIDKYFPAKSDIHDVEIELINKSGERRTISWTNINKPVPLENWAGWEVGIEITQRKEALKALIESEGRFKQLANFTQEGIIVHENGIVVDVNQAIKKITGFKEEELIGEKVLSFVAENYRSLVAEHMINLSPKPYDIEIIKKNKKTFPAQIFAIDIVSETEKRRVVSIRDITEQKQLQQKILNAIIQTEENERMRVAQELHDGIGPVLSTVKLYAQTYIKTDSHEFKSKIEDQLIAGIDDALSQVSTISNNLSPHVLKDFGLKIAIEKYIIRIQKISPINIKYEFNFQDDIDKTIETTLYRVAIELINNTVKHAKASEMEIIFDNVNGLIQFIFTNNGRKFDLDETKKTGSGMGLFNIVNRIKSLNGQINFDQGDKSGIAYNILLPAKLV